MMKKLILVTMLFLTNYVLADGIIHNLKRYVEQYPERIDNSGWVTVPFDLLTDNKYKFSKKADYIVKLTGHGEIRIDDDDLGANSIKVKATSYYIYNVDHASKTVGTCINKSINPTFAVEYIKQQSTESIVLVNTIRLEKKFLKKITELTSLFENMLSQSNAGSQ